MPEDSGALRSRFFELSPEMCCIAGAGGELLDVSPSFAAALGYRVAELVGRPIGTFVAPEDHKRWAAEIAELTPGGEARTFTNEMRDAGGVLHSFAWQLVEDADGTLYAAARDVTEDRRKTRALVESEERLRLVIEGIRDHAVFMLDAQGNISSWNPGAERLKGYRSEEILGRHFSVFYPEEDRARKHPEHLLTRAAEDGSCEDEGWRVRKDGSRFWANVVLSVVRSETGAVRGYVKVTRDFTERQKVLEELAAREASLAATLKERSALLQEIHHRVKNNLQVIASLMNMQMRGMTDDPARTALAECRDRVQAIALIHEKLYASRDYARVPFSEYAASLAENVLRAVVPPSSEVALQCALDEVRLPVDRAIPCGLILNELITNASKHAFPDGRAGSVRVELRRLSEDETELVVADDGVGMSAPVGSAGRRPVRSLGMQLVTTLVDQLDGRMEITGPPGTRLRIVFPTQLGRTTRT